MKTITIKDAGPIKQWDIPIPEDGGVVELRGPNGVGKTHAINAVNALVSGSGKIPVRDGAVAATVTGLGAILTVSRRSTRAGELEVDSIQGKLDISDIIDPGIDDPGSADAKRIKAIINVSGVEASWQDFRGLLPDLPDFDEAITPEIRAIKDPIVLASKVKAAYEKQARTSEECAQSDAASAASCVDGINKAAHRIGELVQSLPGVELSDQYKQQLSDKSRNAIVNHAKLSERRDAAENNRKVRENLESLIADKQPICDTIADWKKKSELHHAESDRLASELSDTAASIGKMKAAKEEYERQWQLQYQALSQSKQSLENSLSQVGSLISQAESAISGCNSTLKKIESAELEYAKSAHLSPVSDREITEASLLVERAEADLETYTILANATQGYNGLVAERDRLQSLADSSYARAFAYRNAAGGVDGVLSQMIAKLGVPLTVKAGRLYAKTQRSESEPLAELSHGQRGKLAIEIGVGSMSGERTGLLTIQQEVWEGLDKQAREDIAAHAKGRKVVILTASCNSDKQDISVY